MPQPPRPRVATRAPAYPRLVGVAFAAGVLATGASCRKSEPAQGVAMGGAVVTPYDAGTFAASSDAGGEGSAPFERAGGRVAAIGDSALRGKAPVPFDRGRDAGKEAAAGVAADSGADAATRATLGNPRHDPGPAGKSVAPFERGHDPWSDPAQFDHRRDAGKGTPRGEAGH